MLRRSKMKPSFSSTLVSIKVFCTTRLTRTYRVRTSFSEQRGGAAQHHVAAATRASLSRRFSSQRFPHGGNQLLGKKGLMQNPNGPKLLGDGQHSQRCGLSRHSDDGDLWKAPAQLRDGFQALLIRRVQDRKSTRLNSSHLGI